MQYLLVFTMLSLLLPLRLETGFVLLRPFGLLAAVLLFASMLRRRGGIAQPAGLLLLLPFLAWHVISAFTAGVDNGLREFLQIAVVLMFALALAQEIGRLEPGKTVRFLLWGMFAILAYSIGWHLAHGYWVGWKHLTDARLAVIFLPSVLAGFILFARTEVKRRVWFAWAGLFPVLVLAGERKALLIYLLLSAALVARGRIALILPPAIGGFMILFVLATMVSNSYVKQQLNTVVDPFGTGQYRYLIQTGTTAPGSTASNSQRLFALKISGRLIAEHPLFGVGTNQYKSVLAAERPDLPNVLRLAIHGEFQRVLTENGIIGLSFYLLVWFASWLRVRGILRWGLRYGLILESQARLLPIAIFVPSVLCVGLQASGTRAFVVLTLISLCPELVRHGLHRVAGELRLKSHQQGGQAALLRNDALPRRVY